MLTYSTIMKVFYSKLVIEYKHIFKIFKLSHWKKLKKSFSFTYFLLILRTENFQKLM